MAEKTLDIRPVIDWLSMAGHTDVPLFTYSFFKKPFWEDTSDWLSHSSLMSVGFATGIVMTGPIMELAGSSFVFLLPMAAAAVSAATAIARTMSSRAMPGVTGRAASKAIRMVASHG